MLLKGTGPSPFLCVIPASEKVLHNTRMTAPPLMSPRMVRSSLSLCRLPAAALGNGYIKANSQHLSYLLGSSFDNYRKAPQWLSSVSYQGSERLRLSTAGERAALPLWGAEAAVPGLGSALVPSAQSASIYITVCSAGQEGPPGNLKLICFQLTRTAHFALACFFSR